ncbi:MAG: discoidin domain-containing protein [Victivallales bacterium]|nr:discoidin domain-containing protein [Victivallales bacterium]
MSTVAIVAVGVASMLMVGHSADGDTGRATASAHAAIEIPSAELLAPAPNNFPRRGPAITLDDTWEALTAGRNLALGKPYQYVRKPNYHVTRDPGDATQLTDGAIRTGHHIWYHKESVGWTGCEPPAMVVVDLGQTEAVGAVVAHVQGGGSRQGGLRYPRRFEVYVSDDRQAWHRVDSISKRMYADQQGSLFSLPESDSSHPPGNPHTHAFHFGNLKTRGRYVALQMWFDSPYIAMDEIAVMAGNHDPNAVEQDPAQKVNLVIGGVELIHPLPYLQVPTNLTGSFSLAVRDARNDVSGPVTYKLAVPAAVQLSRAGKEEFARREITRDGQDYVEYSLSLTGTQRYVRWIHLRTDARELAPMYFRAEWNGGVQPWQPLPLTAIDIPEAPPLDQLIFALGWTGLGVQKDWPGQPEVFRHTGFTHASVGSWELPRALSEPAAAETQKWLDRIARPAGLKLVMIDSPWHIMEAVWGRQEDFAEAYMQTEPPKKSLCLSYRGEYFEKEVERLVDRFRFRKPELILFDVECFGAAGRGLADCARCAAIARERGIKPKELAGDLFAEAAIHIAKALNAAADQMDLPHPKIGYYQCGPGWTYHEALDFNKLYPSGAQISNPEFYAGLWPPCAAEIVRRHKPEKAGIPVVLWTAPGTGNWDGEAPPPRLFDATMEAMFNGAIGQVYYTPWYLSPGDLLSQAHAAIVTEPVEDIIVNAEIVEGTECLTDGGHISAIHADGEMLALVSEYNHTGPAEVTVRFPSEATAQVVDLLTRKVVKDVVPGSNTLTVHIQGGYRSRPFYIGKNWSRRAAESGAARAQPGE